MAAGLVWVVGYSNVLSVRQVEVIGLRHAEESEVRAAAQIPMGRPLIRVDTDGAVERVEQIDRVEAVEVKRSWPRTVRIEVTERVAVGYLSSGSGYVVFDRHGVAFLDLEREPSGHVEVVYAGPAEERPEVLTEVASVISVISDDAPDLWDEVETMEVASRDAIDLLLADGTRVRWGSAERSADKLYVLTVLRQQSASVYDVTAPDLPTTS